MKLAAATIAVAVAVGMPTTANADLPKVPKTAKKLTREIAYNAAWNDGMHEIATDPRWKDSGAVLIVQTCRVRSRWRGWCEYTLSSANIKDPVTGYTDSRFRTVCRHRVTTTIAKRTHRVRSRSSDLGCEVRDISRG